MVCQNQSIDDSDAPIARDLRILVRERLKAGDSNSQVLDYLTSRYGEFVLLRPRLGWHTALLWLLAGDPAHPRCARACLCRAPIRQAGGRGLPGDRRALTANEQAKLAELLRPGGTDAG